MGKYGTNVTGLGAYEGGVNNDKGAPLVANNTDGETALLFGPAALREIQAGVANGDFAIPPDAAGDTITEENPLPYWTFTDASSGIIVPTVVASASTAMGNALRFTIAATTTGKIATFTRYIPIAGNANRVYSYIGQLYRVAVSGTAGNKALVKVTLTLTSYSTDLNSGSASATANYTANSATPTLTTSAFTPDATAAFILIALQVETTGTTSGTVTIDFSEIRTARGDSLIPITDDANPTWLPALISASSGTLTITAPTNNAGTWTDAVTVKAPNFNRGLYVEEGMSTTGTGTNTLFFGDNSSNDTIKILAQNTSASQNYTGDIYSSGIHILGWQGNTIAGSAVTPKVFLYVNTEALGDFRVTGSSNLEGSTISQVEVIASASNTSLGSAGTFVALERTSGFLEVSFTPQFVGQRWLFLFTGYSSLNTTTRQYTLIRADVRDSSNNVIVSPWAYTRGEGIATSGVGSTVAISKVWIADRTTGCKFKLYGTAQTTGGLIISVSYVALTAYPIG
jgi:hypothetical protein